MQKEEVRPLPVDIVEIRNLIEGLKKYVLDWQVGYLNRAENQTSFSETDVTWQLLAEHEQDILNWLNRIESTITGIDTYTDIVELGLGEPINALLRTKQIYCIEELAKFSPRALLRIRGLSVTKVNRIVQAMRSAGYELPVDSKQP